jgi:rhamnopyranosyl-N-acetylglucosaminyl-diphospho-decaprenol beta-1,3/1,4-galactofuranosyltransferase
MVDYCTGGAMKTATVIVTYNRLALLKESIKAHLSQTRLTDILLIVDNFSTDGTQDYLEKLSREHDFVKILFLNANTGGAGGFHAALNHLVNNKEEVDWVWLMDDDAIPDSCALEKLIQNAGSSTNIYGSLPHTNHNCSWPNLNLDKKPLEKIEDFEKIEEVTWVPFLGFYIHIGMIKKIGLPEKDFFLAADDVEYSLRARKHGAKIFIVRDSLLNHPCSESCKIFIGFRYLNNLRLAPWKRYYDTRNRLFVSKKYYGWRYFFHTIPASFLRLFATLAHEQDRLLQAKAFFAGLYDGITGRAGKRHDHWGL